jgi:hypothetical protein
MVDKNLKKEKAKKNRVWFDMNTGTRIHKDDKHPHRRDEKRKLKKMLDKEDY